MRNPVKLIQRLVLDQKRSTLAALRFDFNAKAHGISQLFFQRPRVGVFCGFGFSRRRSRVISRQRFRLTDGKAKTDDLVGKVGRRISGDQRSRMATRGRHLQPSETQPRPEEERSRADSCRSCLDSLALARGWTTDVDAFQAVSYQPRIDGKSCKLPNPITRAAQHHMRVERRFLPNIFECRHAGSYEK